MEAPGIEANSAFSLENLDKHAEAGHAAESCPLAADVDANESATNPGAFKSSLGGLAGEPALRRAIQAAMAIGDWATVKDLAEVLETLLVHRSKGQLRAQVGE